MRNFKQNIPELYLVVAVLYYWTLTANALNWFAIGLLLILGILIFRKNQILGITISGLFILINLFLVLALLSEFSEFETFNSAAKQLLIAGSTFIGLNLFFSIWMFLKYIKAATKDRIILPN